jgi:hypothetical protein
MACRICTLAQFWGLIESTPDDCDGDGCSVARCSQFSKDPDGSLEDAVRDVERLAKLSASCHQPGPEADEAAARTGVAVAEVWLRGAI